MKRRIVRKAFYSDEEDEEDEEEVEVQKISLPEKGSIFSALNDIEGDLDPDHRLVLRSAFPLLKSRNSGVVLGVCALHYYCSAQGDRNNQQVGKALVRILRNHREIQYVVLTSIHTMARDRPVIFRPFLSEFFVKSSDPVFNRLLKLDILTSICFKENVTPILKELQVYIKGSNESLAIATVRAVGRVVDCDPDVAGICMEGLMHLLLSSKSENIIGETVTVLRQLIQQNTTCDKTSKVLLQLAKLLIDTEHPNTITTPYARASIVWLVGEYYEALGKVSSDILRILSSGFPYEATEVKLQILTFAIKLSLRFPDDDVIQNLMTYVLEMARYDVDTDLRDRSRLMTAFMGLAPSNESEDPENGESSAVDEAALEELASHAKNIMLASKLPPVTLLGSVDVEGLPNFRVGSLSSLVSHNVMGYENTAICPWPTVQPDPNVRDALRIGQNGDSESAPASKSSGFGGKASVGDLYKDEREEESSSDSGGEESSDESDEDSESSSESDSSESDEESSAEESSAESESESEPSSKSSSDSESSEDEIISRIPINAQAKSSSLVRQGVRKVVGNSDSHLKSKKDVFNSDASLNLLGGDFASSVTLQPTNTFSAITNLPQSIDPISDNLESFISLSNSSPTSRTKASDMNFGSGSTQPMLGIATQKPAAAINLDPFSPENLGFAPLASIPSSSPQSSGGMLADPKFILKPELGGGLAVSLVFQYGTVSTAFLNASVGFMILKNNKDHPLR